MSGGFALDVPSERDGSFGIYIEGEPDRLDLVVDHLRGSLARDRRRYAPAIAAWLANPPPVRVVPRRDAPPLPPDDVLEALGLDSLRAFSLERSTHVALLDVPLTPRVPRIALWGGFALACAIARAYEGVLYDADAIRIVPSAQIADPLKGADEESVISTIAVLQSTRSDGTGRITTLGLRRYGLPDLGWEDVPPEALPNGSLAVAVNGAAQWLVDEVASAPGRRWVPGTITLDAARFARAAGQPDLAHSEALLDFRLTEPEPSGYLMLSAPLGTADPIAWLQAGLGPIGFDARPARALVAGGDPEMEAAMQRARTTLQWAKTAFNDRGELTYLKRRFETRDGRFEYIWIVVDRWTGSAVSGRLANVPLGDVGYVLDGRIDFDEAEAADWIVSPRNGSRAGNFTGAVLESREGRRSRGA